MKRIKLAHGTARVDDNISDKTIEALNQLSVLAYNHEPKPDSLHGVSCCADLEDGLCSKCKCCDTNWQECNNCGGEGGTDGEELMMEDPMWYSKDDFRTCEICEGKGGWYQCAGNCDAKGKHYN